MKVLLILPIIWFLISCTPVRDDTRDDIVDKSMQAFEYNESLLVNEILLGEQCLDNAIKTYSIKNHVCDLYFNTKEAAEIATKSGMLVFMFLYENGYIAAESPHYDRIMNITTRLIKISKEATDLSAEVSEYTGPVCKKCII